MMPTDAEDWARASVLQSFRRRRWTAVAAFIIISAALAALTAASSALSWGFTLALVASYAVATASGQVLLRRLERRLRGGMRVEEVEQRYRRTAMINNFVLIVLFIFLLLLFRVF